MEENKIQNAIQKIKKHYAKHEEFYKTNNGILIVLGVMMFGFFIGKFWTIKYGIPSWIIAFVIVATQLKTPKKKQEKK